MNSIRKYVVSTTLTNADWNNSTIISGNVPEEVARLKQEADGDILIYGSADLVNSLMKHDLIDEYRLLVFPVVLGTGKRLFRDGNDLSHLRLVDSRPFSSGVVLLTYEPSGDQPSSKYVERFAWTTEQIQSFQAAQNADRVLATILFTDIVDSTRRAAALGDREWRKLLDRHDRAARVEVERFRGHFIRGPATASWRPSMPPLRPFGVPSISARLSPRQDWRSASPSTPGRSSFEMTTSEGSAFISRRAPWPRPGSGRSS
jgi:hypothetical protein